MLSFLLQFSILCFAIWKYPSSNSIPIKFLPVFTQATPVVPLPIKQSRTVSPSLLQEIIWSLANCSGNTAGCFLFLLLFSGQIFQTLCRCPSACISFPMQDCFLVLPSFCLIVPCIFQPADTFSLSFIGLNVFGFPFENTNIYSNTGA